MTCLRTVHSYNLQALTVQRYAEQLRAGNAAALRTALTAGAARALTTCANLLVMALSFWYGGREVERGRMSAEDVLRVFFALLFAVMGLDQARNTFPDLAHGKAAVARLFEGALVCSRTGAHSTLRDALRSAHTVHATVCAAFARWRVLCTAALFPASHSAHATTHATGRKRFAAFAVIDRQSEIDPAVATGTTLASQAAGELELQQVRFAYPARPAVPVLHHFSLRAAAGKVTALVGASGSGKSTVVGLVERFYDVSAGAIYFDGVDVRQLSLPWLRRQARDCRSCTARAA